MWLKIFSSFISVLIIFIISFLTFFSPSESKLNYYSKFQIPQNWLFSVIRGNAWEFIEVKEKKDTQIYLERFDYLDKIFYNKKGSYTKKQVQNSTSLKVWKWKFFLSFSFPKKYEIHGSWFSLSFVWPIKLYFNTENVGKLDVFSFDNVAELTLIWLEDWKEKNKVSIYPHMFFPFDLEMNKVSSNADFFRILQLNPGIWYVNQKLYTNDFKLDSFKNLDNYFFRSILSYFATEYLTANVDDSMLKENFNNMTYDYIKKYYYVFVNDNKKISYYKDLIYMNLLKIYMSSDNSNSLFEETSEYYKNLKNLSLNDYNEMVKVLVYFKNKFLLDNKIESVETETKYDQILSTVFSFQKADWNYMLYYIFNLYDLWKNDNFFDWLVTFSDNFFKTNWLKIKEDKLVWYDESKNLKMWYYISFLENIIKSYLVGETKQEDIKWVFNIFNKYSLLSVNVYSSWNTDKKETMIVLHLNLLKDLSEYIRKNFFEEELDKWIMLVKKKGLNLDSNMVSLFEKSYNTLFNFFTYNKKVFDENKENDSLNLKEYEYISFNFIEYISALKNYNKYKLEKSDLYSIQTIWWDDIKKIIYNIDDITNYLSNFNWVNKDSIRVKTDEVGNTFNVNLNIWWKDFSFDLYPYNNYSIKNIYIDWVKKNLTYSLNLIKEKMDQRYTTASNPEDKNANDFKNFFLITFLKTKSYNLIDDDSDPIVPKKSTEILVFIRDKLLWFRWEFSNIKDFTKIDADNITVDIVNDEIWIKLKEIITTFTYNIGKESNTYWAYIDSDYHIWKDEHFFNNLKYKPYKVIKDWNRNTDFFWLWNDKYITINWNIGITYFKDYMSNLSSYYNYIVFVNDILTKKVWQTDISVNSSKIVKFSFAYNWKNYELLLLKTSIISVKRDWEKITQNTFNYTDLPNRIDLLIK